jgi:TonB-linked SusC/RagA family outer membrane protein
MKKRFHWLICGCLTLQGLSISPWILGNNHCRVISHTSLGSSGCRVVQELDSVSSSMSENADTIVLHNKNGERGIDLNLNSFSRSSEKLDYFTRILPPFISVQQLLKGNASGVFIQETSGEPGVNQNIFMRGISNPLFLERDVRGSQPVVFLNGIPLTQNNPFAFDIQQYDMNPIGPATNLLSTIDINNIESIEVITNPADLARLGPLAANGAIWIITKNGDSRKTEVEINTYVGMVTAPRHINPANGDYEKSFRNKFFNQYDIPESERTFPDYLRDETNPDYFGDSKWADDYYQNAPKYNMNVAVTSGAKRANFRFVAGYTGDAGNADKTSLQKVNVGLFVNMTPLKGVELNYMLSGSSTTRDRNRNFADRFAEMEYLPDLSTPIGSSKNAYEKFTDFYGEALDDNTTNVIQGYINLNANRGNFNFGTNLSFDYVDNVRGVFYPSTILESVNYVSNYSGYNQRVIWNNHFRYYPKLGEKHRLNLELMSSLTNDTYHYNYARAFDGPNDYNKSSSSGNYVIYRYIDNENSRLMSFAGIIDYSYNNIFDLDLTLRYDGSSEVQPDHRWLFTPSVGATWNLKNHFLNDSKTLSDLNIGVSWSRLAKLLYTNQYSIGPQYTSMELSWEDETIIPSYSGFAAITRPYTKGWIGYDMGWPYSDCLNLVLKAGLWDNRLNFKMSVFNRENKDLVARIAVPQELGYKDQFSSGMQVNNRGVELNIGSIILSNRNGLNWDADFNITYVENKLIKLPNGLTQLAIDDRLLEVGRSIDQFWVLKNEGIYNDASEIPVNSNGRLLSTDGVSFSAGDPKWSDVDGNGLIDSDDKILKGHSTPPIYGGLYNRFRYGRFDLNIHLFFAGGHDALNVRSSQRYDFMTLDNENSLKSVKEIFFWQYTNDKNNYPIYNPLSEVHPYRQDQDIFLESLSYVKLRTVSLGYNFKLFNKKKSDKNNAYLYFVANNLLTFTDFSGDDPELVNFNGYYTGYSLPIPRSFVMGFKLTL